MEKTTKKRIKGYAAWICAGALVAGLAAMPMLAKRSAQEDGPQASILTAQAQTGTISTSLRGGGTLREEEAMELSLPQGVKLTAFAVSDGDAVTQGQVLAEVDRISVMEAVAGVQQTLEHLSGQLRDAAGETVNSRVTSAAGGTVKAVYARSGDSVQSVMLEHGTLAVLSLDGKMAVDITARTYVGMGDAVSVVLSDGTELPGRIESAAGFDAVVTLDDADLLPGEEVRVLDADGTTLGTGTLYVHNAWYATAISGTVSAVSVKVGTQVYAGGTLMTLTDTAYPAEFQALLRQRQEYEALMLELFRLYQKPVLTAPCDGVVAGVEAGDIHLLRDTGDHARIVFLDNAPNGDDETLYRNYVGMVTAVDEEGWDIALNPENIPITDYKILTGIEPDPKTMTQFLRFQPLVPIYALVEEQWQQLEVSEIQTGDTLLLAGNEQDEFVWVVRLSADREPSEPAGGEWPSGGGQFFFGQIQEEEFVLHSLERSTVLTVTPPNTMTLTITLDERDMGTVSLGQQAVVRVEALKNRTFSASVTAIATSLTNSGGSGKFTVELTLDRDKDMLGGMSAWAELTAVTQEEVLTIPVAALSEDGADSIVYTAYDPETGLGSPVVVKLGLSDGQNVRVLSGLTQGQRIYYSYYDTLELSHTPESGGLPFGR